MVGIVWVNRERICIFALYVAFDELRLLIFDGRRVGSANHVRLINAAKCVQGCKLICLLLFTQ